MIPQHRAAFVVTGRVQGVGFRWSTRREAERLGIAGTVRNCSDGSVEVRVAGTPDQVRAMRRFLEQGPAPARVEAVREVAFGDAEIPEDHFRVVR